jgi:pilus assembly protein TadC
VDTIKTDLKRAVWSLPFLVSVIIMTVVIAFGAGKNMLFPKEIKYGLMPFYHMNLVFSSLRSNIVLIVVPIICTLPYTAAFLDEYTSGYIKVYLMKCNKTGYIKGKIYAPFISGGLVLFTGILVFFFIVFKISTDLKCIPFLNIYTFFDDLLYCFFMIIS